MVKTSERISTCTTIRKTILFRDIGEFLVAVFQFVQINELVSRNGIDTPRYRVSRSRCYTPTVSDDIRFYMNYFIEDRSLKKGNSEYF